MGNTIDFETASKIWNIIPTSSLFPEVKSGVPLKLLETVDPDSRLSPIQLSWFKSLLLKNPYDKDGVHLLLKYKSLRDLLTIRGLLRISEINTLAVNSNFRGSYYAHGSSIFEYFPISEELRDPTKVERICLFPENEFTKWFTENKNENIESMCACLLRKIDLLSVNETNISNMISILDRIKLPRENIFDFFPGLGLFYREFINKFFSGEGEIERTTAHRFIGLVDSDELVQEMLKVNPKYLQLTFIDGLLDYLMPYPKCTSPSDDQLKRDISKYFSDVDLLVKDVIDLNRSAFRSFVKSIPYHVKVDIPDSELLAYPPSELIFRESNGMASITTRKETCLHDDRVVYLHCGFNDFSYGIFVPSSDLTNVKSLLDLMITSDFYESYSARLKQDEKRFTFY